MGCRITLLLVIISGFVGSFIFHCTESESDANGVLREVWYQSSEDDFEDLDEFTVDLRHIIQTIAAPMNFDKFYQQKLTAYFQVKLYQI